LTPVGARLFGLSIGAAGDVNGDASPDRVIGANHDHTGGLDSGVALVLSGILTLQAPAPGRVRRRGHARN
jgi:hypothetical protein